MGSIEPNVGFQLEAVIPQVLWCFEPHQLIAGLFLSSLMSLFAAFDKMVSSDIQHL